MENYGTELKETPYPLIAALGARDLQTKVLQYVRTVNEEFMPKLHFTSLPIEHRFPVKKEIREKHGTFPNQSQRDFDGYKVQGILKARWLKKHHEYLPAVVLLFHEFDPRWNQKDWLAQENTMRDEMEQLKRGLSGRECRVLLILVQCVDDAGVAPVNITDERLGSLRKRLETDSKGLLLLRSRDITRGSSVLAKLEASIRNYALEYYKAQSKRVKRYKKALNKTTHQALHVRHSFKIAHYYEFRRYTTKVLQHYEAAYRANTALPLQEASSTERNDGVVDYFQVKTMAEYINFKLCYHLIFSSNNIKAAVEQLQRHIKVYGRAMGPVDRAYEHWDWVSRQYHVFAQLLAEATSIRGSLPSAGLDSDVYKEPYLYYSIAAKYATYRRKAAAKLGLTTSVRGKFSNVNSSTLTIKDFVVVPSVFVGGNPVVSFANPPTDQEVTHSSALVQYQHAIERAVPHAKRAIHLLEQAIQFLSAYIANQKTPRSRMKSRLLVQLGTERLAAGEYERARAELQKAKVTFSVEHWWAQTTQILKQLLICTFRQGDTAAFIDYSLQLISPILEEFVPANERIRIQESLLLAWRDPAQLGAPFTADSSLEGNHELALDRSRPIFALQSRFDRIFACVKEDVVLELQLRSHFPTSIVIAKLELIFNDDRYNTVMYHHPDSDEVKQDPNDGKFYTSLEFVHKVSKVLYIPLRVLEDRNFLRFHEVRFHLAGNRTADNTESYLIFTMLVDQAWSTVRGTPKPYLSDGRIPAMGNGQASPSFARRKSMFSLAELGRSYSESNGSLGVDGQEDGFDEGNGSTHPRGSTLAILQPRAKAKLSLTTHHDLLIGDFRVISFRLKSNEDTLENVSFRAVCDPAPASSYPDDAFFYVEQEPGILTAVALDGTLQPRDRTPLPNQAPHTETTLSVIVRSTRSTTIRLTMSVAYSTKSGVHVSLEDRYELTCRNPFGISRGFVHDFPTGSASPNTQMTPKDAYAIVGKAVSLQGHIIGSSAEPLRILSLGFEPLESNLGEDMQLSGFGAVSNADNVVDDDMCSILNEGDTRGFCLRLRPKQAAPFVTLGRVKVEWRRLSSVIPITPDGPQNDIVTTWLEIPTVAFIQAPLTFSIQTPSFGVEGAIMAMEIHVKNNENIFHSLRIKPVDETGEFLISGRTNAVEDLLPYDEHTFRIGLVPTKTGYIRLPLLEIVSMTYNMPFTTSDERRELFVLPCEAPDWKA